MSKKRDEYLEFFFGKYESTSLENRMRISMNKKAFENMIRFYYYVNENFIPIYDNGIEIPEKFNRYKKNDELEDELNIDEVLDEYLDVQLKKIVNV